MDLKSIWEKYAEQVAPMTAGVTPYPSDTAILCALHLQIAEVLGIIAAHLITPPPPGQSGPGKVWSGS